LKKQGSNQQSHQGNNQKQSNSNPSKSGQSHNNANRNSNRNIGHGRKHEPHLWASSASSSTTLTSHLSMINRRNQDGAGNTSNPNGTGRSNGKPRSQSSYKKYGRSRDEVQKNINKSHVNRKPNNSTYKKQLPSEGQIAPNTSAQGKKIKFNGIPVSKTNTFGIDPFELFCAYHLGISSQNQYRPSNINEVANRFKIDIGTTRQILKEYGMDSASLLDRDFDMALAQLDIQVAPEGINRTELGKSIFGDFLEAPIKKRDWTKILEDDKKENEKTFGQ
jgi:hypothetical protein